MVNYHDEIEADFQEYYNLELDLELDIDCPRTARLFSMLPRTSRFVLAVAPAAEWSWDKETQSRILAKLDFILVTLQNAFRDKKKSSQVKPDEQWQPKYVKEAKEEAEKQERQKFSDEEMAKLKAYWKAKNNEARFVDE